MELEYSPRHSPHGAVHHLSPTHGMSIDGYRIRRSLSRSPSKPSRSSCYFPRSSATSPTAPASPSGLSRTFNIDSATEPVPKPRFSVKRIHVRPTRRTSPNSPLRRALSDNVNQANASPRLTRMTSGADGQENTQGCPPEASSPTGDARFDEPIKIDFLLQSTRKADVSSGSSIKSSPLKRSDGVMNLEVAGFASPRNKRRSLHGASLGHDFNILDQGFDGTQSEQAESAEEKGRQYPNCMTGSPAAPMSPSKRALNLRKSTLQQRASPIRSRLLNEAGELSPSLARARSRISLDSALPMRSFDLESPARRGCADDPPFFFAPPPQRQYQSAPKPHPLSHALTPSSSTSSVTLGDHDKGTLQEDTHTPTPPPALTFSKPDVPKPPHGFSKSLPVGAMRPAHMSETGSGAESSQDSYATPDGFKMTKPLPQAFMSTGLISKRNRNMDVPSGSLFESVNMPDTPSKKQHIHISSTPAPPSAFGEMARPTHEFGSPTTPFNGRVSKTSTESFGQGANIFGSRVGAPQLTRRGSFLSEADDAINSPTRDMDIQISNDDLPPTPTKSNSTSSNVRPQSKGKSNSLRSSLFGRRTSIGPDTFASPAADESYTDDFHNSEYPNMFTTPSVKTRKERRATLEDPAMPMITLTACSTPTPTHRRGRSLGNAETALPLSPLARRSNRSAAILKARPHAFTKQMNLAATTPNPHDNAEHASPHTPLESFTPPDPSSLSISADQRTAAPFHNSVHWCPPATPTGPKVTAMNSTQGHSHTTSSYFQNDVDTALSVRFGQVTTLGVGEFSQVYRVEKALVEPASISPRQSSAGDVWAVKKSRKPYTGNKDRQRKMREVQILKELRGHEHLVELVDCWEAKNFLYIQTEFYENGNLKDFLLQTGFKGRLDDFRIWKILLELAQGVQSIHDANFIHLDMKPANIFIDWEGVLKIGDFGMASAWPAPPGLDGEGDREYIGPEVLSGRFDKPADIFSLGMIMLEIAGNIVLPDNGTSWQRLRAGDMSDLPSLTFSSESSLIRDESGDPVDMLNAAAEASIDSLFESNANHDDLDFLRPTAPKTERSRDLVTPPNFMVDPYDPEALDRMVQSMINPRPDERPLISDLLAAGGVQWVERRRRAGATVFEGNWGPADDVLGDDDDHHHMLHHHVGEQQDVEMTGI